MANAIEYPEGYRYCSEIELFKRAVDCTKKMMESGELVILYQFIDVITTEVFISQCEFEQEYDEISWRDFLDILNDEITFLIKQNFDGRAEDYDIELKSYLEKKDVSEESRKEIISLKLDKCKYVNKYLCGEREKNRYRLKNRAFLKKLSNVEFELSRTVDEEEILYSTIKMSVNSALEAKNLSSVMGDVFDTGKSDITFICDKSDIEYLIKKLERIKQMM